MSSEQSWAKIGKAVPPVPHSFDTYLYHSAIIFTLLESQSEDESFGTTFLVPLSAARRSLTSVIRRELVYSTQYDANREDCVFIER